MCKELTCLVCFVVAVGVFPTSPAEAADPNLVGWWKLDEASGRTATDSSGNGNHGNLANMAGTEWTGGIRDGALELPGNPAYIDCGNDASLQVTQDFAIAAWVKLAPDTDGVYHGIAGQLMRLNDADYMGYALVRHSSNVFRLWVSDGDPDNITAWASSDVTYTDTNWHHLVGVRESEVNYLYVDGVKQDETTTSDFVPSTDYFHIGRQYSDRIPSDDPRFLRGLIDDVRLYNRALTSAEIEALAMRPKAHDPSPIDGEMLQDTWASLSWAPGDFAASHDVYFDENFDDVNEGTPATSAFRGNQTDTTFMVGFFGVPYPDGLVPGTTYYWRIDDVNDLDPNSPRKGNVWSFWIPPRTAYDPDPPDSAEFIDLDVTLSWTAGFGSRLHHIHFGDNFDDVNNAAEGAVTASTTHTPGALARDTVYYWRVDEFEAPLTHKGDVWSFKTLPVISITDPDLIGWWTFDESRGDTAVDWSGHDNNGQLGGNPQWVDGVMNGALDLNGDYVSIDGVADDVTTNDITLSAWIKTTQGGEGNVFASNTGGDHVLLFGIDNGNIYVDDGPSTDWPPRVNDNQWHMITLVMSGTKIYLYTDGVQAASITTTIDITAETRWSIGQEWDSGPSDFYIGMVDDARFYDVALTADQVKKIMRGDLMVAWGPSPKNGSTPDVGAVKPLSWSPGDNAAQHDVYFGTDKGALDNADTSDTTGIYRGRQSGTNYTPPEDLAWGTGPYYWRIDQFNTDGTISTGRLWSFTVADFLLVDDFESYNDIPEGEPGSKRIYTVWADGFNNPAVNGAVVGNMDVPLMEHANVHGGSQALPYSYDNNFKSSQATLTMTSLRDWTREGVTKVSLWFYGDPANAPERMNVALNGTAPVYHDDPSAATIGEWTQWPIDLSTFGVPLTNVTSITIGFGIPGSTAAGGTGNMLFDDILLIR
jgi:hypothetical protein